MYKRQCQTFIRTDRRRQWHNSCGSGIDPVSYTHLDVYKRQDQDSRHVFIANEEIRHELNHAVKRTRWNAVSYTHLLFLKFWYFFSPIFIAIRKKRSYSGIRTKKTGVSKRKPEYKVEEM